MTMSDLGLSISSVNDEDSRIINESVIPTDINTMLYRSVVNSNCLKYVSTSHWSWDGGGG